MSSIQILKDIGFSQTFIKNNNLHYTNSNFKKWTKEEDQIIEENFRNKNKLLELLPGRNLESINRHWKLSQEKKTEEFRQKVYSNIEKIDDKYKQAAKDLTDGIIERDFLDAKYKEKFLLLTNQPKEFESFLKSILKEKT